MQRLHCPAVRRKSDMVIEKRRLKRFLSRTSIYENSVLLLVGKDERGQKREQERQADGVDRHRVRDLPGLDALVAREPLKRQGIDCCCCC